jgi:hypothetical protein
MPTLLLHPLFDTSASLSMDASGVEALEYQVEIDQKYSIKLIDRNVPFPKRGSIWLRRGTESTHDRKGDLVNSFRYEPSYVDPDTREEAASHFRVYLQLEESGFDRLVQRLRLGLPRVHLIFDMSSKVIIIDPGSEGEELHYSPDPRPWEEIMSAQLIQTVATRVGNAG